MKAIELLHRLGAEVRVSYDDASTRLHAKAWLFHRDTEYSTAYVGSSNLSHAAQTEGLEWNVRVAQADQPGLFDEMRAVFETYWVDADREPFDGTEAATRRLVRALSEPERSTDFFAFDLEPKEWQKPILRELQDARTTGRSRNLVVAATGTGKTLIAAFDYEQLLRAGHVDSLLFVAHRKESRGEYSATSSAGSISASSGSTVTAPKRDATCSHPSSRSRRRPTSRRTPSTT